MTFINGFEMSWEKTPEKYEIKISVKMTTKAIIFKLLIYNVMPQIDRKIHVSLDFITS